MPSANLVRIFSYGGPVAVPRDGLCAGARGMLLIFWQLSPFRRATQIPQVSGLLANQVFHSAPAKGLP